MSETTTDISDQVKHILDNITPPDIAYVTISWCDGISQIYAVTRDSNAFCCQLHSKMSTPIMQRVMKFLMSHFIVTLSGTDYEIWSPLYTITNLDCMISITDEYIEYDVPYDGHVPFRIYEAVINNDIESIREYNASIRSPS